MKQEQRRDAGDVGTPGVGRDIELVGEGGRMPSSWSGWLGVGMKEGCGYGIWWLEIKARGERAKRHLIDGVLSWYFLYIFPCSFCLSFRRDVDFSSFCSSIGVVMIPFLAEWFNCLINMANAIHTCLVTPVLTWTYVCPRWGSHPVGSLHEANTSTNRSSSPTARHAPLCNLYNKLSYLANPDFCPCCCCCCSCCGRCCCCCC